MAQRAEMPGAADLTAVAAARTMDTPGRLSRACAAYVHRFGRAERRF
jgi:hypothetical protein